MNAFQAIILGAIQGLTEFLPVSSSGHLVIFQHLFGLKEPELFFDISVHMGTLIAVILVFWKEIRAITISLVRFFILLFKKEATISYIYQDLDLKMAFLIIIGSIPTAVLGLALYGIKDQVFSSVFIVGIMLLLTGFLLFITYWIKKDGKSVEGFSIKDALIIGLMQGIAIIPGISRSGSTIAAGLLLGLNRETAARYSFLLSLPAILGAEILCLKDVSTHTALPITVILLGAITAFAVGYCSLKVLLYVVKQGRLYVFTPYCWLLGSIALIFIT